MLAHTPLRCWPPGVANLVVALLPPRTCALAVFESIGLSLASVCRNMCLGGQGLQELAYAFNRGSPRHDLTAVAYLVWTVDGIVQTQMRLGLAEREVALSTVKAVAIASWAPMAYARRRDELWREKKLRGRDFGTDTALSLAQSWFAPVSSEPGTGRRTPSPRDWITPKLLEALSHRVTYTVAGGALVAAAGLQPATESASAAAMDTVD